MREIKFRAWNKTTKKMMDWEELKEDMSETLYVFENGLADVPPVMQFIGIEDLKGNDYYIFDIGEFDNGDRFVLKMEEDRLEVYVDWIGDPDCEDQARDLYRISKAKIIGNIYENPELVEKKNEN